MVVNLVSESCCAFAIVPFKSTKGKRTAVGEDYPPPNSLQRFLTISNVRIIYSHKGAARWNQDVLVRPEEVVLHVHGGWFNLGSAHAFRHLVGHIAAQAGVQAFVPDYRLAPEHPFPAAPEDIRALLRPD